MKGGTRKRGKSWSYYFDTAQIGGKRKKIEKGGFRTKKEAEAALAKALAEYDNSGQVFRPAEISVSDYLDLWFDQYCKTELSEKSAETYSSIIRNHIKPSIGDYRLSAVQPAAIQKFINKLKQDGYAKSTISVVLYIISAAMRYAIEPLQFIRDNPCQHVRVGKVPKPTRKRIILTDAQFHSLLELFPVGTRCHIPILIGWNCGLRINECLGLSWDDIHFETHSMHIHNQILRYAVKGAGSWVLKEPKYNSIRTIKFGETLSKALKAEKKRQLENELLYGEHYTVYYLEDFTDVKGAKRKRLMQTTKGQLGTRERFPLVCVNENGSRVTTGHFRQCTLTVQRELGLPFEYHCLRHTHATKLIEAGASIKAVQKRLGHKDIATTMNTYVHHTDKMAQEAVDLFEAAVNGLPPK